MWDKGVGQFTRYIRRANGGPVSLPQEFPQDYQTVTEQLPFLIEQGREAERYGSISPPVNPLMARAAEVHQGIEGALEGSPAQLFVPGGGVAQVFQRKAYGEDPSAFEYGMAALDVADVTPVGKILGTLQPLSAIFVGPAARGAQNIKRRVDKLMERGLGGQELWDAQANQSKRGYYDPYDGKFRMEIDPSGAQIKEEKIKGLVGKTPFYRVSFSDSGKLKLDDVLDFPEFFEAYPQFKDITVKATPSLGGSNPLEKTLGMYDPFEKTLYMSQKGDKEEFTSTLLHQLQHAVQAEEGFAAGGNSLLFLPPEFAQEFAEAGNNRRLIKTELERYFKESSGAEKLPFGVFDAFAALNSYGARAREALDLIQEMKSTKDLSRRGELRDMFKQIPGYNLGDANNLERTLGLYGSPEEVMRVREKSSFLIDNLQEVEKEYFDLMAKSSAAYKNYRRIPGEVESVNVQNRRADPSLQSQYPPSTAEFQLQDMVSPTDPVWRRQYLKIGQQGPERPREYALGGGVGSLSHIARTM